MTFGSQLKVITSVAYTKLYFKLHIKKSFCSLKFAIKKCDCTSM